jgi:hypothetical protein
MRPLLERWSDADGIVGAAVVAFGAEIVGSGAAFDAAVVVAAVPGALRVWD